MQPENTKFVEKRQLITRAALECFSRFGFDSTSIKMIAQEAGTKSTALIYYYFKDKDDLLFACMTDVQVPEVLEISEDTPPEDWLVRMMAEYLDLLAMPQFKKLILCAYSVIGRRSDFLEEINARFRESHRLRFYKFLDVQIRKGILEPVHYWSIYQDLFYPLSMRVLISGDWGDWNRQPHYMEQLRLRTRRFLKAYAPENGLAKNLGDEKDSI